MKRTTSITIRSLVLAGAVAALGAQAATAETPRDKMLVSAEWLKAHSADKNLVLLQVGDKKEYDAGHIPGARLAGMEALSTPMNAAAGALSLEMQSPDDLRKQMESLGITKNSKIVVSFGSASLPMATRAILVLNEAGYGKQTSLLDGGSTAWQAAGYPMSTDAPAITPTKLTPFKMQGRIVDADFVQAHLKSPGYKVIDARAPMFYDGLSPGAGTAKGHLPGAVSVPFMSVQDASGKLKSADELSTMFKTAGVSKGDHVVVYCHIGAQATAVIFAARSVGIDAQLYDGSFQDWTRRGLPVEAPPASTAPASAKP